MAQPDTHTRPPTSSLLDRLHEHGDGGRRESVSGQKVSDPNAQRSSRGGRSRQMSVIRNQITDDLVTLLGTRHMAADTDLSAWPWVARSVLNFGVPDLSGSTASGIKIAKLESDLLRAIRLFEPRLHQESVVVKCRVDSESNGMVLVNVEALFGPRDAPEAFAMGVSICLGSGQVTLAH